MGCRKNLTRLTPAERAAFVAAVNALRENGVYDTFIDQHFGASGHGHGGPAFFPWHREYILRFERALQAVDPAASLPYWDWTVDNLNPAGTQSLIWRDDFMGGPGDPRNGFRVMTGPFAAWGIRRNNLNDSMWPWNGTTNPFGLAPWAILPERRRPADLLEHRALGYFYDTLDPAECARTAPPLPTPRPPRAPSQPMRRTGPRDGR